MCTFYEGRLFCELERFFSWAIFQVIKLFFHLDARKVLWINFAIQLFSVVFPSDVVSVNAWRFIAFFLRSSPYKYIFSLSFFPKLFQLLLRITSDIKCSTLEAK